MAVYEVLVDADYPSLGTCAIDDSALPGKNRCEGGETRSPACTTSPKYSIRLATSRHYYCSEHLPEKYKKQIMFIKRPK